MSQLRRLKRDGSGWTEALLLRCPGARVEPRVCRDSFLADLPMATAVPKLPQLSRDAGLLLCKARVLQEKIERYAAELAAVKGELVGLVDREVGL